MVLGYKAMSHCKLAFPPHAGPCDGRQILPCSSQNPSGRDPLRVRLSLDGDERPGELYWLAEGAAKKGQAICKELKA
jgi:hypothetical protein